MLTMTEEERAECRRRVVAQYEASAARSQQRIT
jgi:hypothetical protein